MQRSWRDFALVAVGAAAGGVLLMLGPGPAIGHGGGLDRFGCHADHASGAYHCHGAGAPLADRSPDSGGARADLVADGRGGAAAPGCAAAAVRGFVTHVRDGDTIELDGMPIRLFGIAAPELREPGGNTARRTMQRLVSGRELRCNLTGRSTFDRCEGSCFVGGDDLAAAMVRAGQARDCPAFSGGLYAPLERPGSLIMTTYERPPYCSG